MKALLFLFLAITLSSLTVYASPADLNSIDILTRRQLDLLYRSQKFSKDEFSSGNFPLTIGYWKKKWKKDRTEFLLVEQGVATESDVRNAFRLYKEKRTEYSSFSRALESVTGKTGLQDIVKEIIEEAREQTYEDIFLLKELLKQKEEYNTKNILLGSYLSKNTEAANLENYLNALGEVRRRKKKQQTEGSCCWGLLRRKKIRSGCEWMRKLYGPEFEERMRIQKAICYANREMLREKASVSSLEELLHFDDDEHMIEILSRSSPTPPQTPVFPVSVVRDAMELARHTSLIILAVQHNLPEALRHLIQNPPSTTTIQPAIDWTTYSRSLVSTAVENLNSAVLKTLLEFSPTPDEDFKAALRALIECRQNTNVHPCKWKQRHVDERKKIVGLLLEDKRARENNELYELAKEKNDKYIMNMLKPKMC